MTTSLRNILIFIGVVILMFELGSKVYESSKKAQVANPIAKDGKIKENRTVTFEEEEELAEESFPPVKDQEYNDNSMYAFGQCIIYAGSADDNSLACLGNLISESKEFEDLNGRSSEEKGQLVYEFLTERQQVTNVKVFPKQNDGKEGLFLYNLYLSFNRDTKVSIFEIEIRDRKIVRINKPKS